MELSKIPGRTETGNKTKEMNFSFMNLNAISFSTACVAGGIVLAQVREVAILVNIILSKPELLYLVMEVLEAKLFTQFFGCMLSGV